GAGTGRAVRPGMARRSVGRFASLPPCARELGAGLMPDPVRRLGLGTVQFGQAYGVSNIAGQVPLAEVQAMLARGAGEGVAVLDTAANYGQAEEVLARCDTRAFRIVSKTVSVKNGVAAVIARARQS